MSAEAFADPERREQWIREKNIVVFQLHSEQHRETRIDLFVEEPFDSPMTSPGTADNCGNGNAWLEHELSQLRYFRSLTLREKMQAVEGMADIVRRLEEIRRRERSADNTDR